MARNRKRTKDKKVKRIEARADKAFKRGTKAFNKESYRKADRKFDRAGRKTIKKEALAVEGGTTKSTRKAIREGLKNTKKGQRKERRKGEGRIQTKAGKLLGSEGFRKAAGMQRAYAAGPEETAAREAPRDTGFKNIGSKAQNVQEARLRDIQASLQTPEQLRETQPSNKTLYPGGVLPADLRAQTGIQYSDATLDIGGQPIQRENAGMNSQNSGVLTAGQFGSPTLPPARPTSTTVNGDFYGPLPQAQTSGTTFPSKGDVSPFVPNADFAAMSNRSASAISGMNAPLGTGTTTSGVDNYTKPGDVFSSKFGLDEGFQREKNRAEAEASLELDRDNIVNQELRAVKAQIRASNAVYKDMRRAAQREGSQRVGEQRAQSARGGLLGSDFGTQQAENVLGYNREIQGQISNQQQMAEQEIYATARGFAEREINNLRAMKQQGGENYLKALSMESEMLDNGLMNTAQAMIAKGVDPRQMDPARVEEIAAQFKADPNKLLSFYQQSLPEVVAGGIADFGGGQVSEQALLWANSIQDKSAKLSDVPDELKEQVLRAMGSGQAGQSPRQKFMLDQANVAEAAFERIFNNPALDNGALKRGVLKFVPGSNAKDLKEAIGTLKGIIGVNQLQEMRNASPTGGALGQVSDKEINFLQALEGSLNTAQSDEQLFENLVNIKRSFDMLKLVNSPEGVVVEVDGVPLTRQGEDLIFQAPDGKVFRQTIDGDYEEMSFNQESQTSQNGIMEKIIGVESGGDYNAQNPNSSAFGKYQFIDSTREQMASAMGMTDAQSRSPQGQEAMFRQFTADNQAGLSQAGYPITAFTTYAAHQQGLGGAKQIFEGNVSPEVENNMLANLPQNARHTGDTRTDWINYWSNKMA